MTKLDRNSAQTFDAVIIGAGAAGLFCAGVARSRGLKILVIDHSEKIAEKIRISGGGRCNFTNKDIDPRQPHKYFIGENPQFCRSALSKYTQDDFLSLLKQYDIPFHEKHKGQLFCDNSSKEIIDVLLKECNLAGSGSVEIRYPCSVLSIRSLQRGSPGNEQNPDISAQGEKPIYELDTDKGKVLAPCVVIATGGLSIPMIGASDFGYKVAKQFNLPVVQTRPALVPLTFESAVWGPYAHMSGLSLPVVISTGTKKARTEFAEDLLFTHRGLSGPGILQISSYWRPGDSIQVNLAPGQSVQELLIKTKDTSRKLLVNELSQWIPSRLAQAWTDQNTTLQNPINQVPDQALTILAKKLENWELIPSGTEGYKKAEVTAGGVSTKVLNQQTMESTQKGLYFIGEVVDITGWLGGYNFQWAWSSGFACANNLPIAA
jgi:predicted Rossmann fold flavoprotein